MTARPRRRARWAASAAELALLAVSVLFLVTLDPRTLTAWLLVGALYLVGGAVLAWPGRPLRSEDIADAPSVVRWTWLPPLVAAGAGVASAVTALLTPADAGGGQGLVVTAALGVILSWALLQSGFAQVYLIRDAVAGGGGLRFPGDAPPSVLDYLYFAFTLGSSFATSDVEVAAPQLRRIVLVHSVLAFFYNALVVAIAFQVLQQAVAR